MRMSQAGIVCLQALEGWRSVVYRDEGGRETIGYGHLITAEDKIMKRYLGPISRQEGAALLGHDIARIEPDVSVMIRRVIKQNEFDALMCFAFNLGAMALRNSRLLAHVNAGSDEATIEAEFMRWCRVSINGSKVVSQGLLKRRAAEVRLWRGSDRP